MKPRTGLAFAKKVRFGLVIDHLTAQLGLIRTLRGLTPKFGSFNDEEFDELQFERHLASNPALAELECWYWIRKLQARFFAGLYTSAVDASLKAQRQLWTSPSQFETAELQLLWCAFPRRIVGFRVSRPGAETFRGSSRLPQAARNMVGELPGEFREPSCVGGGGNSANRGPFARRRGAL